MQPPLISVVTPSYNQAEFLSATIDSVLSQDYPHVEYLVLDGGSTDASPAVIRRYADQLDYWVSEPDDGQADAIARGFRRAQGDLFCWLNSDDVLLPGALSTIADYFTRNPDAEVVSGGAYSIDAAGHPLRSGFGTVTLGVPASYNRLRFYEQDGVFQPATFWRRSAYEAVGGVDPSLRFAMDHDLFVRLAQRRRFDRLPHMLACFRVHGEAKSSRLQVVRAQESAELKRRYGVDRYNRLTRAAMYARYRAPSVLRKIVLKGMQTAGVLPLREAA